MKSYISNKDKANILYTSLLIIFIAWVLLLSGCGSGSSGSSKSSTNIIKSIFIGDQNSTPIKSVSIHVGESETIYPYAEYLNEKIININVDDPQNNCKWLVENNNIISLNNNGTEATLQAKTSGNTSVALLCQNDTLQYKINAHIIAALPEKLVIKPDDIKVPLGGHEQLYGVAYYSDGESKIVNPDWSIQDDKIAIVDNNGLVTGKSVGYTKIRAILDINGHKLADIKDIQITPSVLQTIIIQGESIIVSGTSKTYKAIGVYSDDRNYNITNSVLWYCASPLECNNDTKGIINAQSGAKKNETAEIRVTDPTTKINSESIITVVPISIVKLTFNKKISKCINIVLNGNVMCEMKFLAVFNDGQPPTNYWNFTRDSFKITIPNDSRGPSYFSIPTQDTSMLILYGKEFDPLPKQVTIQATAENCCVAESTFEVQQIK